MAKKLFLVTITSEVLYAAESIEEAQVGAEHDKCEITRDEEWDMEVSSFSFVPYGWGPTCRPFNSDVPLSEYAEYKKLVDKSIGGLIP